MECQDAIYGRLLVCESRLLMALEQLLADPVENSCQDLAWHRGKGNPSVVVTLLGFTLSLPDENDNAPSLVGHDDRRVPNGTQRSVQPQEGGHSPRFEYFSVDTAPSKSFVTFQLAHCPLNFLRDG